METLLRTGIICNFISVQLQTFEIFETREYFYNFKQLDHKLRKSLLKFKIYFFFANFENIFKSN